MKKADFIQAVCDEINTIKKKATKKEINKLDFNIFEHSHTNKCIYGQMTGECNSFRAIELSQKKLENVSTTDDVVKKNKLKQDIYTFKQLNFDKGTNYTYLEAYLFTCGFKIQKQIIQYLKSELNELYL